MPSQVLPALGFQYGNARDDDNNELDPVPVTVLARNFTRRARLWNDMSSSAVKPAHQS